MSEPTATRRTWGWSNTCSHKYRLRVPVAGGGSQREVGDIQLIQTSRDVWIFEPQEGLGQGRPLGLRGRCRPSVPISMA